MTYLTLRLECECGRSATSVQEVGFTDDHQLILRWRCPRCKRNAYVLKPLQECWRDCPTEADDNAAPPLDAETVAAQDAKFLQALGVKFPD